MFRVDSSLSFSLSCFCLLYQDFRGLLLLLNTARLHITVNCHYFQLDVFFTSNNRKKMQPGVSKIQLCLWKKNYNVLPRTLVCISTSFFFNVRCFKNNFSACFFFSLLLYQRYSSVGPCSWTDAFILDLVFCHQFCLVSRRQVQILSRIFVCYLIPYLSTHLRKVWLIKASFSLATDCSTYMSDQLTKGYRPNLQATAEQCYCLQKPCRGLFS